MTAHFIPGIILDVSVGSILHDNCCLDHPDEYMCNGLPIGTYCEEEWNIAADDYVIGRQWKHTFGPYDAQEGDDITIVPPREGSIHGGNERASTIILAAPEGTRLRIDNEAFCSSGEFKETSTLLNYGICGEVQVQPPIPDIKANGSDGPISINTGDNLSLTFELDPGSYDGENADWWVVEKTPSGLRYLVMDQDFTSAPSVFYQNALFDPGSIEILNTSSLDAGTYTYYFGVDLNMDGALDTGEGQLYYDKVTVTVIVEEECADIAGKWSGSETITATCCLDGDCETETFSGKDTITIQQDGCNISYYISVSGYGNFSRTGIIAGNNIQLSGKFAVLNTICTATKNTADINGTVNGNQIDLQGTGIVEATCDGMNISCTGGSTAVLTRSGSSSALETMDEEEIISGSSPQLLNEYLKIFTTIAH